MHGKPTLLVLFLVWCGLAVAPTGRGQSTSNATSTTAQRPALPVEPTGAMRCIFCHRSQVEGYARSTMAHSLRRAGREPEGEVDAADAKITMQSLPTGYWQRLQSSGETLSYRIDYVVGSGNHASGYLLDLNGHLFQSPVAYYKSRKAYDLAPGYEGLRSPDFTRPVAEGCLFCHSGAALYVSGTANEYRSPIFSAEMITCERCHGSAEKHLADPRAGTIVNPAKLEPAARDSICEQCHLLGVGRVLNPGMKFGDFRPGERLEDVFTTYVNTSPPGETVKFKVISHVEQLARSTCAKMSNGRLWCGTCHDPHDKPLEAVQFFRSKCLSCHTSKFSASHPGRQSNCIGCHMPRRDAKDGGHTAFIDHRIQRRPDRDSALPEQSDIAAWREPAPELQKRNLGIASINVGMDRRSPAFIIQGYRMLAEVQRQFSNDSETFTSIGTALLAGKQTSEAVLAFERASQLNPNSATAETSAATACLQAANASRAMSHLERAVKLDPLDLPAESMLVELYQKEGNTAKAAEQSGLLLAAIGGQFTHNENEAAPKPLSTPQPVEAVLKNIQVLQGMSSEQLIPSMRFIAASLGVECGYCHVPGAFDKDDKKPKQIARNMMRMMFAIDKDDFGGSRQVTCYSCHRGSIRPEGTPVVASEGARQESASVAGSESPAAESPTAAQLIDRYVQALGGADAIEKIASLVARGSTTQAGHAVAVEVFDQNPDKRSVIRHLPGGDAITTLNGHEGWASFPGRPLREILGDDLDAVQIDADLHFALHIPQRFAEQRVEYSEQVAGRAAYVISCANVGKPPTKLYFDKETGLLVRVLRYTSSLLGLVPTQIDYDDYREVGSAKIPFRWRIAETDGISTTQLEDVRANVPIDEAEFARPSSTSSLTPASR